MKRARAMSHGGRPSPRCVRSRWTWTTEGLKCTSRWMATRVSSGSGTGCSSADACVLLMMMMPTRGAPVNPLVVPWQTREREEEEEEEEVQTGDQRPTKEVVSRTTPYDKFVAAYQASTTEEATELMRCMWNNNCIWREYHEDPRASTDHWSLWRPPLGVDALNKLSAEAAAEARDARAARSGQVGCEVAVLALQELQALQEEVAATNARWWIEQLRASWVQHFDVHMLLTTSIWRQFWRPGPRRATPQLHRVALKVRLSSRPVYGPCVGRGRATQSHADRVWPIGGSHLVVLCCAQCMTRLVELAAPEGEELVPGFSLEEAHWRDVIAAAETKWATWMERAEHERWRWSFELPMSHELLGTRRKLFTRNGLATALRGGQRGDNRRGQSLLQGLKWQQAATVLERLDSLRGHDRARSVNMPERGWLSGGASRMQRRGVYVERTASKEPPPHLVDSPADALPADALCLATESLSGDTKPLMWAGPAQAVQQDRCYMGAIDGDGLALWRWSAEGGWLCVHVRLAYIDTPEGCAGLAGTLPGLCLQHVFVATADVLLLSRVWGWIPNFAKGKGFGKPRLLGEVCMGHTQRWGAEVMVGIDELQVRCATGHRRVVNEASTGRVRATEVAEVVTRWTGRERSVYGACTRHRGS